MGGIIVNFFSKLILKKTKWVRWTEDRKRCLCINDCSVTRSGVMPVLSSLLPQQLFSFSFHDRDHIVITSIPL